MSPPPPDLPPGTVHLWEFELELDRDEVARLDRYLDREERQRGSRRVTDRLRRRFAIGRGRLREILARYCEADPGELRFRVGEHGKPRLAPPWDARGLEFNLSHSGVQALLAVSLDGELGVDIERRDDARDLDALAERFFAPAEAAALRALPPAEQVEAFYRCWTRKEAYLKALGGGLSFPLHLFTVCLDAGCDDALIASELDPSDPSPWRLREVPVASGHCGALCAPRAVSRVVRMAVDEHAEG